MKKEIWELLQNSKLLDGKVALITGAAAGIGKSCAELFSNQGASVLLVDRDEAGLKAISIIIETRGGTVKTVQADLTDFFRGYFPSIESIEMLR